MRYLRVEFLNSLLPPCALILEPLDIHILLVSQPLRIYFERLCAIKAMLRAFSIRPRRAIKLTMVGTCQICPVLIVLAKVKATRGPASLWQIHST